MASHRVALADPLWYAHNIDTNAKVFKDFFTACRTRRPVKKCLTPAWEVDKVLTLFKFSETIKKESYFIPSLRTNKGKSHKLCPVDALKNWSHRTDSWDNPQDFLWFNAASRKPANARLLALRFRQLIQLAYTDKTEANFHQIRKVATSLTFDKGLNLNQMCSRANWAGQSVFLNPILFLIKAKLLVLF
ncbi:unnamed protein product [Rotaria magnacalcarata]|uniref:Uncharacterized protein n=1 Tax=Rotaria magnacalcarata TaxID=392030 RepID=A0A820IZA3_9BILA|nr:unnamed protein product [Rotaria magnacalcarata]